MVPTLPTATYPVARSPRSGGDGPGESEFVHRASVFSPLRRGWSPRRLGRRAPPRVLPAQAGMVPIPASGARDAPCSPRSGGDGPPGELNVIYSGVFSPLRRGWSPAHHIQMRVCIVLPAQAGMVRRGKARQGKTLGSPRSGGDGPGKQARQYFIAWFSPLRRGWSAVRGEERAERQVLPAQAGMVPYRCRETSGAPGSPRSGGDGPVTPIQVSSPSSFSPLRRGWSERPGPPPWNPPVLPAQAGMVRAAATDWQAQDGSPRSGGDGPSSHAAMRFSFVFSPLRRGWSLPARGPSRDHAVLPAQAGMVRSPPSAGYSPMSSPRSGGDGPVRRGAGHTAAGFSPLRRGWSKPGAIRIDYDLVLPAQAGMVLHGRARGRCRSGSPRSGGDGPATAGSEKVTDAFSPLRRGWSREHQLNHIRPGSSPRSGGDGPPCHTCDA